MTAAAFRLCRKLHGPNCSCERRGKLTCESIARQIAEVQQDPDPTTKPEKVKTHERKRRR